MKMIKIQQHTIFHATYFMRSPENRKPETLSFTRFAKLKLHEKEENQQTATNV